MRLIDADAISADIHYWLDNTDDDVVYIDRTELFDLIDDAPTIEPKRGKWEIEKTESVWGKGYMLTCSECGDTFRVTENALSHEHFCRNCGADMRGKDDD